MHELSVAKYIIEIIAMEAKKQDVKRVTGVNLEIGQLSGIEFELLEFALKNLAPGTPIESSEIFIEKPEGKAQCNQCGNEFAMKDFIGSCNMCGSVDLQIIRGRELRVQSIIIE